MDLSTYYLGLHLKSPILVSACQPLTETIRNIREMEDCGAGAVVLYSLFEEQIAYDKVELMERMDANTDSFAEATHFFPEPTQFLLGPEEYLEHITKAKKAVRIPIIASLNGATPGGWTQFAKKMEQAGADAIELNIYKVQTNSKQSGADIEKEYLEIARSVKNNVSIPVSVKLSPFFTSVSSIAKQIDDIGIKGLVLFNRFYQPDIDLENLEIRPDVMLSTPVSLRLPLRWIALLYGNVVADLAGTSGIHRPEDAIKIMMAGAKVGMVCASLLKYGISYLKTLNDGISKWMEEHEYPDLDFLRGSMSQAKCPQPDVFERVHYIRALHEFRPKRNPAGSVGGEV